MPEYNYMLPIPQVCLFNNMNYKNMAMNVDGIESAICVYQYVKFMYTKKQKKKLKGPLYPFICIR
jgi:hypothetical protein